MIRLAAVLSLVTLSLFAAPGSAQAQEYPTRTITIVVPTVPGGPSDIEARIIARKMEERLGVAVVVQNVPGAGMTIGHTRVARAAPDGYTLGHLYLSLNSKALHPEGTADPLGTFDLIAPNWTAPLVLAVNNEQAKARTLADFIAYGKANQGKLNYGDSAAPVRLAQETFNRLAGLQMQAIPYKGNAQATAALFAGEIQAYFGTVGGAAAFAKTGKVAILGVADDQRLPGLPDVPTMAEAGIPMKATLTGGVFGPAGLPRHVVAKLEPIVREAVNSPEMEKVLREQRGRALTISNAEYLTMLRQEITFWNAAGNAAPAK